jgi:hypothetical protein
VDGFEEALMQVAVISGMAAVKQLIGLVATITRTVPDGPFTGSPSAHEQWP